MRQGRRTYAVVLNIRAEVERAREARAADDKRGGFAQRLGTCQRERPLRERISGGEVEDVRGRKVWNCARSPASDNPLHLDALLAQQLNSRHGDIIPSSLASRISAGVLCTVVVIPSVEILEGRCPVRAGGASVPDLLEHAALVEVLMPEKLRDEGVGMGFGV
jgi:hypothetical protein